MELISDTDNNARELRDAYLEVLVLA